MLRILLLLSFISLLPEPVPREDLSAAEWMKSMFSACAKVRTMEYVLNKGERIGGKILYQRSYTKVAYGPFRAYSRPLEGEQGPELLYNGAGTAHKTLVDTHGFPWFNLSLDPKGSLMRKDQHHTFLDAGYIKLVPVLLYYQDELLPDHLDVRILGREEVFGEDCIHLDWYIPDYKWVNYQIKSGETLAGIEQTFRVPGYLILERNTNLTDWDKLPAGEIIQIPTAYGKRIELWISSEGKLLRQFKVYDDQGLYEHFTYEKLAVNLPFTELDFDRGNPDYGF
ncbi:MAG: DUF1571 domain-containing protein [Bacteroidia bacterium]|nr:DUF1571 domain-containing protein [Bacteroidia bacterium]